MQFYCKFATKNKTKTKTKTKVKKIKTKQKQKQNKTKTILKILEKIYIIHSTITKTPKSEITYNQ